MPLRTFRDVIQHGIDYLGGAPQDAVARDLRGAAMAALDHLGNLRRWNAYLKQGRTILSAPYETGTIQYTHSPNRLLVLTGGTWPAWAANATIVISGRPHISVARLDDTTLMLHRTLNPGADVAAGTSFKLIQDIHPAPEDFLELADPKLGGSLWRLRRVTAEELWRLRHQQVMVGDPAYFAIGQYPLEMGRKAIFLWPAPQSDMDLDYAYHGKPRALRWTGYEAEATLGTVSATGGSTSVTGTGTGFKASMAGAVIRFGTNSTTVPTGLDGISPYAEQAIIGYVQSTTSLFLASAPENSASGVKYIISDPIDVPDYLWPAYLRGFELELARRRRMGGIQEIFNLWREAIDHAAAADGPSYEPRSAYGPHGTRRRLSDYPP
jgi:hypothetical protein